jgi:hypothetical protein
LISGGYVIVVLSGHFSGVVATTSATESASASAKPVTSTHNVINEASNVKVNSESQIVSVLSAMCDGK